MKNSYLKCFLASTIDHAQQAYLNYLVNRAR